MSQRKRITSFAYSIVSMSVFLFTLIFKKPKRNWFLSIGIFYAPHIFFCQITSNVAEKYIFKRVRAMPKQKKASFGWYIQKNQQLWQYRGIQGHVVLKRCLSCVSLSPRGAHIGANRATSESLGSPDAKSFVTPPAPGTNGEPVDLFWPPDAEFLLTVTLLPQHQTGTKRSRPCVP